MGIFCFVKRNTAYEMRIRDWSSDVCSSDLSGTLSYAMGVGKPVISTPYWHAAELLADDHGPLVPFGDTAGFAAAITSLFDHPSLREILIRRAYARGRTLIWPPVSERVKNGRA